MSETPEIRITRAEVKLDHIERKVDDIAKKVDVMHDFLMQARGAKWLGWTAVAFFGGVAALVVNFFRAKLGGP